MIVTCRFIIEVTRTERQKENTHNTPPPKKPPENQSCSVVNRFIVSFSNISKFYTNTINFQPDRVNVLHVL